ncbi:MFS transporter [Labrys sp. 22185]|uniref:MFS transporter n=1 Tax=Labrys sp. 22185 TaxID=3453888 RepID=UPI003F828285
MSSTVSIGGPSPAIDRLPVGGLLALAMAGFITIMTEVMPAGLLPQMGGSLGVSDAVAGQLVTTYAAGSLVTAIPLMTLTQSLPRRLLLLIAIIGFAALNAVTAMSSSLSVTLVARFLAGACGGMVWALLTGYAARMAPSRLAGRAIALTGIGAPLAFSLGVPAGTFIGTLIGWRLAFGLMSVVALLLAGWILAVLPDFAGRRGDQRLALRPILTLPGIRPILAVMGLFVVAHNLLYTYIAPFLVLSGLAERVDVVLLCIGLAGLAGLWVVGALIDRRLRLMVLGNLVLFGACAVALGLWSTSPVVVLAVTAVWGMVAGGIPTLFQTASVQAAGEAADVAQTLFVTVWNSAVAVAGLAGGALLGSLGATVLPWAMACLLALAWLTAWLARSSSFPKPPAI